MTLEPSITIRLIGELVPPGYLHDCSSIISAPRLLPHDFSWMVALHNLSPSFLLHDFSSVSPPHLYDSATGSDEQAGSIRSFDVFDVLKLTVELIANVMQYAATIGAKSQKNVIKIGLESHTRQVWNMCTWKWENHSKHMSWKGWFWCSRPHGIFSLLYICWIIPKFCGWKLRKWIIWVPVGPQRWKEGEVQETNKKQHQKSTNICHKYGSKGGLQNGFSCFLGLPSRDGLQGVPGQAQGPKNVLKRSPGMQFHVFQDTCFILLEDIWSCFALLSIMDGACTTSLLQGSAFTIPQPTDNNSKSTKTPRIVQYSII